MRQSRRCLLAAGLLWCAACGGTLNETPATDATQALLDAWENELARASHLVDLCLLHAPQHAGALRLSIQAYRARLLEPAALTQERLVYLDAIAAAQATLANR